MVVRTDMGKHYPMGTYPMLSLIKIMGIRKINISNKDIRRLIDDQIIQESNTQYRRSMDEDTQRNKNK
jgi:archaellum component FlaG (FlaF/FlaG flagellin family)